MTCLNTILGGKNPSSAIMHVYTHTHTHTHMNKVYAHLKLDILPTVDVELYNVLGKKLTKFMKPNILNHEQVKVCF